MTGVMNKTERENNQFYYPDSRYFFHIASQSPANPGRKKKANTYWPKLCTVEKVLITFQKLLVYEN